MVRWLETAKQGNAIPELRREPQYMKASFESSCFPLPEGQRAQPRHWTKEGAAFCPRGSRCTFALTEAELRLSVRARKQGAKDYIGGPEGVAKRLNVSSHQTTQRR